MGIKFFVVQKQVKSEDSLAATPEEEHRKHKHKHKDSTKEKHKHKKRKVCIAYKL